MKHGLRQGQRVLQKLAITSKMKHSIQMLGMSIKDLNEYIETALVSNPFLKKEVLGTPRSKYERRRSSLPVSSQYNEDVRNKTYIDPRDSLLSQLRMLRLDEKEIQIAEYLISDMDENGYIKTDLEEVSKDLLADPEEVCKVLDTIQGLDPAGIGARDIRECLQL